MKTYIVLECLEDNSVIHAVFSQRKDADKLRQELVDAKNAAFGTGPKTAPNRWGMCSDRDHDFYVEEVEIDAKLEAH